MISPREKLLLALVLLALLGVTLWSYTVYADAKDTARQATDQTAGCRALAAAITRLRAAPALAAARDLSNTDLTTRITAAARSAGIDSAAIARIDPEPPRRAGGPADNSPFITHPVHVSLRRVTLQQLVAFLHTLSSTTTDTPLQVPDLKLSAPHTDEDTDRWTADFTVTATVFAPAPQVG